MQQKSWPISAPARGGGRLEGGDAGVRFDADAAGGVGDGAVAACLEQLDRPAPPWRRSGRRRSRPATPALPVAGKLERVTDAGFLVAEVEAVLGLARASDRR